jgi:signal transduction histidine kinase
MTPPAAEPPRRAGAIRMRGRLLASYLSLFGVVLAAMAAALAATIAVRDTQAVFIDRQADTARFASLAESAMRTGQTVALRDQLTGYDALFGIAAAIVSRDGKVIVASRGGLHLDAHARARIADALTGERAGPDRIAWPWQRNDLVVAEPVGRGGEIIGVAVTISPLASVRARVTRWWLGIAAGSLLAVLVSGLVAARVTGWIMRPVVDLDDAAHAIADGRLTARVAPDAGPVELRRLATSFNTMADRISGLLDRQRTFVSYASHQLRNPLTALRLRVETLGVYLRGEGAEEHALTIDEVDRLARICDGLLALTRAESTRLSPTIIDAAAVADDRIAAWAPVARRADVMLVREGADDVEVAAPVGILDQVIDALVDNALKFAGPGARVTVSVDPPVDGRVGVHVTDDGPGLPAGVADAADPTWRTDHQRHAGSGLGLTIAATLINACGGTLDLAPAAPHGLHAHIRLPAHAGEDASPATASSSDATGPHPDAAEAGTSPTPPAGSAEPPPDARPRAWPSR